MVFSDEGTSYGVGIAVGLAGATIILIFIALYCRYRKKPLTSESTEINNISDNHEERDEDREARGSSDVEFEWQRVKSQHRVGKLVPVRIAEAPAAPSASKADMIVIDHNLDGSLKDVPVEELMAFESTQRNLDDTS
jgi:hypothetical protein